GQLRFVIESLEVRRTAGHVKEDNPSGSRSVVKRTDDTPPALRGSRRLLVEAGVQQAGQRHQPRPQRPRNARRLIKSVGGIPLIQCLLGDWSSKSKLDGTGSGFVL